jgi:hypothetical protein
MVKKRATKRKATKTKRKTAKTKRKTAKTKRKTAKTKRKTAKTKRKTKKAFGGYSINFKNRDETLEQVFGKAGIAPSEMTKKLWKFIKNKRLGHK